MHIFRSAASPTSENLGLTGDWRSNRTLPVPYDSPPITQALFDVRQTASSQCTRTFPRQVNLRRNCRCAAAILATVSPSLKMLIHTRAQAQSSRGPSAHMEAAEHSRFGQSEMALQACMLMSLELSAYVPASLKGPPALACPEKVCAQRPAAVREYCHVAPAVEHFR
ncbi:hypothetical protein AAHC03_0774 [Spirometra sp. Aus1]